MVCCCLFSGDPIDDDPRKDNVGRFKVGMIKAPCEDPACCLASCICPCCAQIVIRNKALDGDMSKYVCCQGYMDGLIPCFKSGKLGEESCPSLCLCLEAFCCNSCAVSATRMLVMDERNLMPDEWDNRIIRCNNCLQMASCICDILSICFDELREAANIIRLISNCVYFTTQGCMTAQVNVELKESPAFTSAPPVNENMDRGGGV